MVGHVWKASLGRRLGGVRNRCPSHNNLLLNVEEQSSDSNPCSSRVTELLILSKRRKLVLSVSFVFEPSSFFTMSRTDPLGNVPSCSHLWTRPWDTLARVSPPTRRWQATLFQSRTMALKVLVLNPAKHTLEVLIWWSQRDHNHVVPEPDPPPSDNYCRQCDPDSCHNHTGIKQLLTRGPGPHSPGATPSRLAKGHSEAPSPDPQNTCGLFGRTPMRTQQGVWGWFSVLYNCRRNLNCSFKSRVPLSATSTSPAPWTRLKLRSVISPSAWLNCDILLRRLIFLHASWRTEWGLFKPRLPIGAW